MVPVAKVPVVKVPVVNEDNVLFPARPLSGRRDWSRVLPPSPCLVVVGDTPRVRHPSPGGTRPKVASSLSYPKTTPARRERLTPPPVTGYVSSSDSEAHRSYIRVRGTGSARRGELGG